MPNEDSSLSTFLGIVVVVVLGLAALWVTQFFLGFVWNYLWWILGAAAVVIVIVLFAGAQGARRE